MDADSILLHLREICMAQPDVEERLSHGEPAWFVRKKRQFASFANCHGNDRIAVWCAATLTVQESQVAERPEVFFRPPYVGHRGWIGIYLDGAVDWSEVSDFIAEAHRQAASVRLRS